jgi:hypothetical protein
MTVLSVILVYVIGYILTLILLHKFKSPMGIDVYDGQHDDDDWQSNSEAYAGWSFAWPLLWIILAVNGIWFAVCLLSAWLDDK